LLAGKCVRDELLQRREPAARDRAWRMGADAARPGAGARHRRRHAGGGPDPAGGDPARHRVCGGVRGDTRTSDGGAHARAQQPRTPVACNRARGSPSACEGAGAVPATGRRGSARLAGQRANLRLSSLACGPLVAGTKGFCDYLAQIARPHGPACRERALMSIGIWQVLIILLIVLVLFGAGKLPRVMGDMAKGIKSFKAGLKDDEDEAADDRSLEAKRSASEAGKIKSDEAVKG